MTNTYFFLLEKKNKYSCVSKQFMSLLAIVKSLSRLERAEEIFVICEKWFIIELDCIVKMYL